jgi:hypothetical protein
MQDTLAVPEISKSSRAVAYGSAIALAMGGPLLFAWHVFVPALAAGTPPATWTWGTLVLAQVAQISLVAWLGLTVYRRFTVTLSHQGISFPSTRGRDLLSWTELERVTLNGADARFYGAGRSVVINLHCFKDPAVASRFVWANVPPRLRPASMA